MCRAFGPCLFSSPLFLAAGGIHLHRVLYSYILYKLYRRQLSNRATNRVVHKHGSLALSLGTALLGAAVVLWTIWPLLPVGRSTRPRTLLVYGFAIVEKTLTRSIFPAFQKKWKDRTGEELEVIGSFGGSGTITNQLIMGVPAELAILSTELDLLRLRQAGVLQTEAWKELPHQGIVNRTPFVILVGRGNPKGIREFADLARPGVRIVHPDPLTSGAANWAIMAEYGAALRRPGASSADGQALLLGIWRNVVSQAGSGRAARTQFDNGFGDVLITYEQDILGNSETGSRPFEIVYPRSTISSEHTVVAINKHIRPGQRELVRAFLDFLWSDEAQRLFVKDGFRSVEDQFNRGNTKFGTVPDLFLIHDFGGWLEAKKNIIDGIWKDKVLREIRP